MDFRHCIKTMQQTISFFQRAILPHFASKSTLHLNRYLLYIDEHTRMSVAEDVGERVGREREQEERERGTMGKKKERERGEGRERCRAATFDFHLPQASCGYITYIDEHTRMSVAEDVGKRVGRERESEKRERDDRKEERERGEGRERCRAATFDFHRPQASCGYIMSAREGGEKGERWRGNSARLLTFTFLKLRAAILVRL